MSSKLFAIGLLLTVFALSANAQRIVVDTASTSKYLIKPEIKEKQEQPPQEELDFSDRALSIGKGILNRLKARLNLEEASESLKEKKERLLGKPESEDGG